MNTHLFALVYVDDDRMDIGGNLYPEEGYIEAVKYTKDINIENGLYGIKWASTYVFNYEKFDEGIWILVKIEDNDDIITVNAMENRIKFRNGIVLFYGKVLAVANFIDKIRFDKTHCFMEYAEMMKREEIVGTPEWRKIYNQKNRIFCEV